MILSDLASCEMMVDKTEKGAINFAKMIEIGKLISQFEKFQRNCNYSFPIDENLKQFLQSDKNFLGEDQLTALSYLHQPKLELNSSHINNIINNNNHNNFNNSI